MRYLFYPFIYTYAEFVAFLARYSLASGIPLMECIEFLLAEAKSIKEVDLALEGWKVSPVATVTAEKWFAPD